MCRIRIQILPIVNRNVLFNTLRHKNIKHQDYFNNFVKKMGYVHMKLQLPKYTTSQKYNFPSYNFSNMQFPKKYLLKYEVQCMLGPEIHKIYKTHEGTRTRGFRGGGGEGGWMFSFK